MDTDKAYLLGLIIGGGIFGDNTNVLEFAFHTENGALTSKIRSVRDKSRETYFVKSGKCSEPSIILPFSTRQCQAAQSKCCAVTQNN